jgi:hypothetical protein
MDGIQYVGVAGVFLCGEIRLTITIDIVLTNADRGKEMKPKRILTNEERLLIAAKGAVAALTQSRIYPADIRFAKDILLGAITKVEGRD